MEVSGIGKANMALLLYLINDLCLRARRQPHVICSEVDAWCLGLQSCETLLGGHYTQTLLAQVFQNDQTDV